MTYYKKCLRDTPQSQKMRDTRHKINIHFHLLIHLKSVTTKTLYLMEVMPNTFNCNAERMFDAFFELN